MEKGIKGLLIDELHDILSAETQIVEALPKMVTAAESPDLKKAFSTHLKETRGQVVRLKKIFKLLKLAPKKHLCKAAKGLIEECKEVLKEFKKKSPIRDAALISKAQRIEHYEISAYGTTRTFAEELHLKEIAHLLQDTLNEEANADKKLTKIAEGGLLTSGINHLANAALEKKASHATKRKKASSTAKRKTTSATRKKASSTAKRKTASATRKKAASGVKKRKVVHSAKKKTTSAKKSTMKKSRTSSTAKHSSVSFGRTKPTFSRALSFSKKRTSAAARY